MLVLRAAIESFWFAVQFLTRLPVPDTAHFDEATVALRLRQALLWFPLIGGLIGGITAAIVLGAETLWPRVVAVLIALIIEARMTGAFHEDAVADFCDAMGGGLTREDKLRIFKDSRIGSYGALGLLLAVALRAALLVALPAEHIGAALIASGVLGRLTILFVMAQIAPIVDRTGLAKDIAHQLGVKQLMIAALIVAPFLLLMPLKIIGISAIACALFAFSFAQMLRRVLGGSTGDCLGFSAYAGQLLTLLVFTANLT
jgi:adenosylcobinamide-GDP ribazoletransferase